MREISANRAEIDQSERDPAEDEERLLPPHLEALGAGPQAQQRNHQGGQSEDDRGREIVDRRRVGRPALGDY
ncbi:hypothetical protein D9M73_151440 [compost metagenome]